MEEDLWCCLQCGHIACGRMSIGHAGQHFFESRHPVCMDLVSGACFCYDCNSFISQEEFFTKLSSVYSYIQRIRGIDVELIEPPKKRAISCPSIGISPKRSRKSKALNTVGTPGKTGLVNLQNTCFMNAVLQSLFNTPIFSQFFLSRRMSRYENKSAPSGTLLPFEKPEPRSILVEMSQLFVDLQSGRSPSIEPEAVYSSICRALPRFGGFHQHDAQEFLRFLLDEIHKELSADELEVAMASQNKKKKRKELPKSVVLESFQGSLLSEVKCPLCGKISRKFDPFLDLSVHIPKKYLPKNRSDAVSCNLIECLEGFVGPEVLGGLDQYSCKSCTSSEPPLKKFTIFSAPQVLCLHIKRFRWPNRTKITTQVEFPEILDLALFMKTDDPVLYSLFSVINHNGFGTWAGHYTSSCNIGDQWILFDDATVSLSSWEDVQSSEAYILFYKKITE